MVKAIRFLAGPLGASSAACLTVGFLSMFDAAWYSLSPLFYVGLISYPCFLLLAALQRQNRWISLSLAIIILPLGARTVSEAVCSVAPACT